MARKSTAGKGTSAPLAVTRLVFSFEFYDTTRPEYCLSSWNSSEILRTLACLKDLSTKTLAEILTQRRVYHFYETFWERTVEPRGFPDERANALDAFHFALIGVNEQRARVFGALSGHTFYIVWFDRDHLILPARLKHTSRDLVALWVALPDLARRISPAPPNRPCYPTPWPAEWGVWAA
jgi:hypothetical protein